MRLFQALFCACFLFMITSTPADAAALLSVYQTSPHSFTINGSALDGVSGIDLTIVYTTPALQGPTVTKGALVANAFMDYSTGVSGQIGLSIASTTDISGSGQIVAIQFASSTDTGRITSATGALRGVINGTSFELPVTATTTEPGDCDYNGTVTIAEVQSAINMFLGINTVKGCVDIDTSNTVTIAEVQRVINAFLGL